ncbi:hypothetical protein [Xanthomonas arboricola]|nr:hypothetical protein [Xanthomonas arboricola]
MHLRLYTLRMQAMPRMTCSCDRGDGVVLSNSQQSIALAEMSAIEV